ncbi:hypothetical protein BH20VER3_BH20VER3_14180 [soil metagenome]
MEKDRTSEREARPRNTATTERCPPAGRKHPAHWTPIERGNQPVLIFLTVCSAKQKPILANDDAAAVIVGAWQEANHWLVGRYIILPDHIHLFCAPGRPDALPVQKWVAFWKSKASKIWPHPAEQPIWQMDCWDTQLRAGQSYDAKWDYVRQNAVRHGLVVQADDWPYQGELNILQWHEP